MFKVPLVTSDTPANPQKFWDSVFLYHKIPHVVNRRIICVVQLFFLKIKFLHDTYTIKDILKYSELYSQVYKLDSIESKHINTKIVTSIFDQYDNIFFSENATFNDVIKSEEDIFISVRILMPRYSKASKCVEFIIIDKKNKRVSFIPVSTSRKNVVTPNFEYDIELDAENFLKICVSNIETAEEKECDWLVEVLFSKLMKWIEEDPNEEINSNGKITSLSLISNESYCELYQELKEKYGKPIVKKWPEKTDPSKYVFEDIAIATYILLLWKKYSLEKQKFVDLGCGNGLLVHILNSEGHDGVGYDIRPRKIWYMYPESTKLNIQTIVPSSKCLYPKADWIIGNHSDELSVWIPVIAARSSSKCKYFLLPCCSYEFDGNKYQRSNPKISQYQDFLQYIQKISDVCGFETEVDKLRIPSTKRICVIGANRKNTKADIKEKINSFIKDRIGQTLSETNNWLQNYKVRSSVEEVKNCTKLSKDLIHNVTTRIFIHLLSHDNYTRTPLGKNWNTGSKVPIPDLINLLTKEELKELKNECGGLQTLLKNQHFIFRVSKGTVELRMPTPVDKSKKVSWKARDCWFHLYHPDGCSLDNETCNYIHT